MERRWSQKIALACAAGFATEVAAQPGSAGAPSGAPPSTEVRGSGSTSDPARDAAERADEIIIVNAAGPRGGGPELIGEGAEARDRRRGLADSAFVTIVHVDERAGETRGVAEAVGATVGAEARSLGGLGSFSSIAVRGASPGHTQVLVDGVALSRLGTTTVDLSRFELDGFSQIELYRGGVPVALGGAGVGGALNLVTHVGRTDAGERWRLSLGGGSYGARSARVRYGDGDAEADGEAAYVLGLGYAGADGDFSYFDDGGTNLVTADDRYSTRTNNGYEQLDAVARAAGRRDDLRWQGGVRALSKRQGVPGSTSAQATQTQLDSRGLIADGSGTFEEPGGYGGLAARIGAYAAIETQAWRDPDGEVGLGSQDRRYLTVAGGALVSATLARGNHRGAVALEVRGDRFRDRDEDDDGANTDGIRFGAALAVSDDISGGNGRIAVEPALRLEALRYDPLIDSYAAGAIDLEPRHELFASPRVGGRALVTSDLAFKLSGGRYTRVPTALELFGDRGFIVGRPDLRSEHGWVADGGAVWAPREARGAIDRIYLETAGFWSRPRDAIVYVAAAGVARPINIGTAEQRGIEVVASARAAKTATATANYTLLDARQYDAQPSLEGKRLPGRPLHSLYGRVDVARTIAGRVAAGFVDASYTSGSFLDDVNLAEVPARWLLGAGAKLELGAGISVAVEVKNLADARTEDVPLDPPPRPDLASVPRAISDLVGYPLPGRAFYLRLDWSR